MKENWEFILTLPDDNVELLEVWLHQFAAEVGTPHDKRLLAYIRPPEYKPERPPKKKSPTPILWNYDADHAFHFERVMLWIDWNYSDKVILSALKKRIAEARPRPPIERRGRALDNSTRYELQALAALRLCRSAGSVTKAMKEAQRIKRRFWSKPSDWYKAKNRALKIINDLDIGWCPFNGWPEDRL